MFQVAASLDGATLLLLFLANLSTACECSRLRLTIDALVVPKCTPSVAFSQSDAQEGPEIWKREAEHLTAEKIQ